VIGVGLGLLRLPPDQFWAMTPREFAAAARRLMPNRPGRGPGRSDLAALMRRFPDQ
jgi:uncharacterized phage protein (TIGR02216 family)